MGHSSSRPYTDILVIDRDGKQSAGKSTEDVIAPSDGYALGGGDPTAGDAFLSATRRQPPADDQLGYETHLNSHEDENHRIYALATKRYL